MPYLLFFGFSLFLSLSLTPFFIRLGFVFGITDKPSQGRKIHKKETPLLGGMAIFIAFFAGLFLARDYILAGNLEPHHWLGFFAGACFLFLGGILDDKYDLSPGKQFVFPILACLAVLAGGVGVEKITNPFGGLIFFDNWQIPIFFWKEKVFYFSVLADIFTFVWILGMMYTTKLLDGLDGLAGGVSGIASFIIFLFTLTTRYYQSDIAMASIIFFGAIFGFLVFNWHPAKIFLGEGGSLFLGFALGVLSVISGAKVAIALLVMGIPIMDTAWTIVRRILRGKNPFRSADRMHLHHRLLSLGWGQRRAVFVFYVLAGFFGLSGLFLQSRGKILALLVLFVIMFILISLLRSKDTNNK